MEQFSQNILLYKIYWMNSFIGKHIVLQTKIGYWKNIQQEFDLKHSATYYTSMISLQHKSMQWPYINSLANVWWGEYLITSNKYLDMNKRKKWHNRKDDMVEYLTQNDAYYDKWGA